MIDNKNEIEDSIIKGRQQDILSLYVNAAKLATGNYDFQIVFSQQTPSLIDGTVQQNDLIRIIMSPQHAKVFSEILNVNIQQYEKEFGHIEVNENFINGLIPNRIVKE